MTFDWQPVFLTLKLASLTMICLLVIATPIAWWLSRSQHWSKRLVETLTTLPLILPPTVLGFYLLIMLGPNGPLGTLSEQLGLGPLVFSFSGLLIGSIFYSLPFAVQPLHNAFSAIDKQLIEAASTLRAKPLDRFFSVIIPLARPGFLSAAVLSFAHTVGEFGVVLMIGGNIPGETQVLSIAMYDHVEALEYQQAHWLAGGMLVFAFSVLYALYHFNH